MSAETHECRCVLAFHTPRERYSTPLCLPSRDCPHPRSSTCTLRVPPLPELSLPDSHRERGCREYQSTCYSERLSWPSIRTLSVRSKQTQQTRWRRRQRYIVPNSGGIVLISYFFLFLLVLPLFNQWPITQFCLHALCPGFKSGNPKVGPLQTPSSPQSWPSRK